MRNEEKCGVVYELSCKDCDSMYIGETGRWLSDRIKEHKKDVEKEKLTSNFFVMPNQIIMYSILKILKF